MRKIWVGIVMLVAMQGFAQKDTPVLVEIGNEKITTEEFLHIYSKNNRNQEISYDIDSLNAYMDLFVNFKLKVVEAKSMGLDTMKSFKSELNGYRGQLAQPYLTDRSVEEELIREAYKRSKFDVNASHILIKLDGEAVGADTVKAYQKALKAHKELMDGADFVKVVRKYSEDESKVFNNGSLGYFTVFGMVYPFETAAYNTEKGNISEIVRTRFGYHILKVNDKRAAKGRRRVAHIMVVLPKGADESKIKQANDKVALIQSKLDAGEDFAELAKEFSDDRRSGRDGGLLPWFGVGGKMIPTFEQAAFELENVGDVSPVLKTAYGYHFIKLIKVEPIGSFEDNESKLKNRITNSARASKSKNVLVNRLMDDYNAQIYENALSEITKVITDSIFFGTWDPTEALQMNGVILSFADRKVTQGEFAQYLKKFNRKSEIVPLEGYIKSRFKNFTHKQILSYEEEILETKYDKFKYLMKEYHDGILLFNVTDQMVWSKAVKDSTGLENFYNENKDNYMWDVRYDVKVLTSADKKQRKAIRKYLKKNHDAHWHVIDSLFNAQDSMSVTKEHWTIFEAGESAFADELAKTYAKKLDKKGRIVVEMDDNRILDIRKIPSSNKELNEARGIITADYQNYLEKQWIKELHGKYNVVIHKDVLQSLTKN